MFVDIGYYAMLAALVLTLYGIFTSMAGIKRNSYNLIESGRIAQIWSWGMVVVAYAALTYAFIVSDFSLKFVANNSSTDLPLFYKLTGVWGGLDGSLLLWQLILSSFTAIVAVRYKNRNREMLPYILIVFSFSTVFLLFLLIGWSNPFAQHFPIPTEGRGLNPLLQNPGMVIHPPALYIGYVGFNVPFAFAMAALLSNRVSEEWILATRRWSLIAWFFLTMGMLLGGNWAYVELGWGGYWAWDPVENASLMPWLTGTAFLHSVIVQEKRNSLKLWNMLLIITTFVLSILGTFITRSGVLNSVHAFSKSNIGPAFLFFIALIMIFSFVLLFLRQDYFKTPGPQTGLISKENSFLFNNVLFVAMAFTVLYGTLFPLLAEGLADKKISIQAPFFNSIMLPLGLMLLLLMGITQLLGWKKTSMTMLRKNSMIATIGAVVLIVGGLAIGWKWQLAFLAAMGFFALYLNLVEMWKSIRASRIARASNPDKPSFWQSIKKDRRKRGGIIIHLGVAIAAIGFCGNFLGAKDSFSLYPGESKQVGKYKINYVSSVEFKTLNANEFGAQLNIFKDNQFITKLTPSKAFYPTRPEMPMTEVAIYRTVIEDLYISVASMNEDGSTTLDVYINPLVNLVWASMGFFIVGMFFSLSYKPVQLRIKKEQS